MGAAATKAYLVSFNLASAAGWGYVGYLLSHAWTAGFSPEALSNPLGVAAGAAGVASAGAEILAVLKPVQTLAIMEVVHPAVGLVRTGVFLTFLQVLSRQLVVWGQLHPFPTETIANNGALFSMMIAAWSITEVIRYTSYALKLLDIEIKPLTFLRYTLFIVLYPAGVTGELSCLFASGWPLWAKDLAILTYLVGFPPLYFHMWAQRKKVLNPRKPLPIDGVQWPEVENKRTGKVDRSSTSTSKAVFAAAVAGVSQEAKVAIESTKNWRHGYPKHVIKNVELSCNSEADCLKIARAGLEKAHSLFTFVRNGRETSLKDAMKEADESVFVTRELKGNSALDDSDLVIPYKCFTQGKGAPQINLKGGELIDQLDEWVANGTIEPSCRDAIKYVAENPECRDLSKHYFCLLGAGAAMGPLIVLLSMGANIIAVDYHAKSVWDNIFKRVKNSPGRIIYPVRSTKISKAGKSIDECDDSELAGIAGCDLFTDTPEIATWIISVAKQEKCKELNIGGYVYLPGERFVRAAMAMDAIQETVMEGIKGVSLGFLCSPTDVFVVDQETRSASQKYRKESPLGSAWLFKLLLGKKALVSNEGQGSTESGGNLQIVNGIVVEQGPNYVLAKRIQHWRCMLAYSQGHIASSNIAPSTATVSVLQNASFAAAYNGFKNFKAMEVMYQETSNSVMCALLVHDLLNPESPKNPKNKKLGNPIELFAPGAFHGGVWRCPYQVGSIGITGTLIYYWETYWFPLVAGMAGSTAVLANRYGLANLF